MAYDEPEFTDAHRLYKLDDGMNWGCMPTPWEGVDMIWIDPADEECFESLLGVLRRGNFDTVLEAVGEHLGLESLMVQGIGPIFLSHFDHDPEFNQLHRDLIGVKGSFYNVVVPLYIPKGGAPLYVEDLERHASLEMRYNVGTLLGAESLHGTAECDYRADRDVRLSVAIYLADVNEENLEMIASDSTSLWPTQGDMAWFNTQRGRFWKRDGSRSMVEDKGREPLGVEDFVEYCEELMVTEKSLCMEDPTGVRLDCPKTCEVYSDDALYYSRLQARVTSDLEVINARDEQTTINDIEEEEEVVTARRTTTDDDGNNATAQIEWMRSKVIRSFT